MATTFRLESRLSFRNRHAMGIGRRRAENRSNRRSDVHWTVQSVHTNGQEECLIQATKLAIFCHFKGLKPQAVNPLKLGFCGAEVGA
jgi:hypothetical protein